MSTGLRFSSLKTPFNHLQYSFVYSFQIAYCKFKIPSFLASIGIEVLLSIYINWLYLGGGVKDTSECR